MDNGFQHKVFLGLHHIYISLCIFVEMAKFDDFPLFEP